MIVSSLCIIEKMYRSFRSVIPLNSLALLRVVELLGFETVQEARGIRGEKFFYLWTS